MLVIHTEMINLFYKFVQVYIYRLFWSSPYEPKVIVMSDLKRKFPSVPEQMYRSKLNVKYNGNKFCATSIFIDLLYL